MGVGEGIHRSGGVVTLLFTDLVGSTELLDRLGDDEAEAVRRTHFALLRQAVSETGGEEVKNLGDGLMVAFVSPVDGLACSVAMQRKISDHNDAHPAARLRIRVGLHVGDPPRDEDDFFGTTVVVAKRLCDKADGGQILASELLAGLVGSRGGFVFRSVGGLHLKGLHHPVAAVSVEWSDAPSPQGPAGRSAAPAAGGFKRGPAMAGRRRELATLRAELERAGAGEMRCVLITGEAGVGKTRLAAEVLHDAKDSVTVLSARAHPLGATASFGLWAEALDRHLRSLPDGEVARLAGGFLDDLAGILRSVAAVRGQGADHEAPRSRLLEGLAVLMSNLAAQRPVVAVLDDVHLGDASSWETLDYLARTVEDLPLLVVATARPGELATAQVAAQVLFRLEEDDFLRRLALEPLAVPDVGALAAAVLGSEPPPTLVYWLADRSRGNPLFAHGLLRALLDEGADLESPVLRRLPEGLTERVTSRIRTLDDETRSVLEVLATVGHPVRLADLLSLSGRPLEEVVPIVDRLIAARLVSEDERERDISYEITHPLVGETIYRSMGAARRMGLHRLVGRILLGADRLAEASLHFARSAEPGDQEAIGVLLNAVRQAEERDAWREALTILSTLVDLLPSGDQRWLEVADALSGRAEWVVEHNFGMDVAQGIRAMQEIERVLEARQDPGRLAEVKSRLAIFRAWGTGELDEAEGLLGEAVGLFEEAGDHPGALNARLETAYMKCLQGDYLTMKSEAPRILAEAEAAGDGATVLHALGGLGFAAFFRGDFDEAEGTWPRVLDLCRELGNEHFATWAYAELGYCAAFRGQADVATRFMAEARAVGTAFWRDTAMAYWETVVLLLAGDLDAALRNTDDILAWNVGGMNRRGGIGMAFGALAAVEAGRHDDARRYLALGRGAYEGRSWSFYSEYCDYAEALLLSREDAPQAGVVVLQLTAPRLLSMGVQALAAPMVLDLAELAALEGDGRSAHEAALWLDGIAAALDLPLYEALAAVGSGWVSLAHPTGTAGGTATVTAVGDAVKVLAGLGCRLYHGRALDVLGRLLTDSEPDRARDTLTAAAEIFEGCGAVWRRDRALEAGQSL